MKIDVVYYDMLYHSWNYNFGFIRALKEIGYLSRAIDERIATGKKLEQLVDRKADLIVFLGSPGNYRSFFSSEDNVQWLRRVPVPTVCLFEESLTFDEMDALTFGTMRHAFYEVPKRCLPYFSHVVTPDEADVETMRDVFGCKNVMWLPMWVDENIFRLVKTAGFKFDYAFWGSVNREKRQAFLSRLKLHVHHEQVFEGSVRAIACRKLLSGIRRLRAYRQGEPEVDDGSRKGLRQLSEAGLRRLESLILKSSLPSVVKADLTQRIVKAINETKIIFNLPTVIRVFTSRVYETLACGRFLLQPKLVDRPRSSAMFRDGKHLVYYDENDPEECKEIAEFYLFHEKEREAIARAGREEVLKNYTCKAAIEKIIKFVKGVRLSG